MNENVLEKTNRVNLLFDFYAPLLTEKQRTIMACYFHDNLSLGEIAGELAVSRQAVYEHIKRAETTLDDYERKLQLLEKYERRLHGLEELETLAASVDGEAGRRMAGLLTELKSID
jgi:predicted DNA-binding protein YlxM (UPF0122 family)